MIDKIASLVTKDGRDYLVKKRTAAVIAEVYTRSDEIESCAKGTIEIIIHVKDSMVNTTLAVRKVGKCRRIE